MLLTDLREAVVGSGLPIVETNGWRTRGQRRDDGSMHQFVAIRTILCHHTAGPATGNMPSLNTLINGRPGLDGPLSQLGLARDGTVYLIAAGVAWHAGEVTQSAYNNWHAIGIEAEATGTSSWPAAQMDAYARLCAALAEHYNVPNYMVLGHKEVCDPPGRKPDPNFDMDAFRGRVARAGRDWFDMATKEELVAACREALWGIKIPVTPGSKAAQHYGPDAQLSIPNALFWLAAESVGDADQATLVKVSAQVDKVASHFTGGA